MLKEGPSGEPPREREGPDSVEGANEGASRFRDLGPDGRERVVAGGIGAVVAGVRFAHRGDGDGVVQRE